MQQTVDLAWAAGFLEGEGSFCGSTSNGQFTASAGQVQREPLERLQVLFGGSIRPYVNNRGTHYHKWAIHGAHSLGVAFTLYVFMSPRRREQIRHMVAKWKLCPGRSNRLKTHCPRGHAYSAENTYLYGSRRKRHCRICVFTVYPETRRLKEATA